MKRWIGIGLGLSFIFLLAYWFTPSNRTETNIVLSQPTFQNKKEAPLTADAKQGSRKTSSTASLESEVPQKETFSGGGDLVWKRSYQDDDYIVYDSFYSDVRIAPYELRFKKLPNGQMTLIAGQGPEIIDFEETFPRLDISLLKKQLYDENEDITDIQEIEKQWIIDPADDSLVPVIVLAISGSKGPPHGELWNVNAKNQNILSKVQRGRH